MMKVGLVQMHCTSNREENLKKAFSSIRETASKGAQIVCLPELFCSEYFCQTRNDRFFSLAETIPGPSTDLLGKLAKELGISILASLYEKTAENKYFNTTAVIGKDGALSGVYRKMHIPDDPANGYDEAYYFSNGDLGIKVFDLSEAKVAPMVCWDQWFPEGARMSAVQGAQILFYPTAIGWPLKDREELNRAEHDAWQIIQRSHAIANNVFVVAVNRVGLQDSLNFWGTSFVADPYGRVLAKASTDKEENLVVECDLSLINDMRKDWPFLDYRRFHCEKSI
jgi:N-carbamoylputrescine amidase